MDFITPFTPALAEAFLLVMVCVILLVDVFLADAQRWITYALTMLTLLGCFLITGFTAWNGDIYTFSGMFIADAASSASIVLPVPGSPFTSSGRLSVTAALTASIRSCVAM